jgi:hypothetical protein
LDAYFRENPSVIVINDKDAISSKRPLKYIQQEEEDIRREQRSIGEAVLEEKAL